MKNSLLVALLLWSGFILGQDYKLEQGVSYINPKEKDSYRLERCKIDIYYPTSVTDFPTVVWFHGGGLEGGEKFIPEELTEKGIAVVAVNYRLSPKAKNPSYLIDAAESVAWVFDNIAKYGGSSNDIYVAGHSAGGYLALMVGLDKSYLANYNIDANKIKGLIPISGQTNTHYTIRKERGLPDIIPIIDEFAPINKARKDIPPTLLIVGDRKLELAARYEENAHIEAVLKALGSKNIELFEIQGFDHGEVCSPGCLLLLKWIKKYSIK